jgi:RimJ/RimL family protein N-acetyltransferase
MGRCERNGGAGEQGAAVKFRHVNLPQYETGVFTTRIAVAQGVRMAQNRARLLMECLMHLVTDRLILRPHTADDFPSILALWRDPEVVRRITGAPATREEAWARTLLYVGHWASFGFGFMAATEKTTGAYLGDMGLAFFERDITPSLDGFAEAGWAMNALGRGRGLVEEGMRAMIARYAAQPNATPLACIVSPKNAASLRVAEKLGFAHDTETTYRSKPIVVLRRG